MPKALFSRPKPVNRAPVTYVQSSPYSYQNDREAPTELNLRAFLKSGTLYGIVSLLGSDISAPEWRMYRKTQDNRVRYSTADTGSDQRVEVYQHQALKVLNAPNPHMSRMELFEISQNSLELTGEAYWLVDYGTGAASSIPVGIWPVRADRMTPVPDPVNFIKGYYYTSPDGERVPFKPSEVLLIKQPNPLNPYRGAAAVDAVMADVEAGSYAAQYNRNFFYNDASPGGILQVPNPLSDEEFDQLANRMREGHRGVSRAHRVAILDAGMEWKNTSANAKDMAFVELVDNSRDKIREAYRIHPIMLGQTDDVNRANAQTGEDVHTNNQTIPKLTRWRDFLNYKYLPLFGKMPPVEFDFIPPVPANRFADMQELNTKMNAWVAAVKAGADPDSAAEVVGLPAMKMAEKATQEAALPPGWVPAPPAAPGPATPAQEDNTP